MEKSSHRIDRAEAQIMREVARLIQRDIEDPRIKNVVITRVSLSVDLKYAKIFFTLLLASNDDKKLIEKTSHALNHSVSYLRRRVASHLKLRYTPELYFVYDTSTAKAEHLINVINRLDVSKE